MDRIAPKLVVGLVMVILALLIWVMVEHHQASEASARADLLQDANDALESSVVVLGQEITTQERHAVEALMRAEQGAQKLAAASRELNELKAKHETLRAYLDSGIPVGVERVLLAAHEKGAGDQGSTAGFLDARNAEAATPGRITHQAGWSYCAGLEVAIDNCNADKAAMRAWKEGR